MEVPKQKDRWDSPYFEVRYNEETPFAEIEDVLFNSEKKAKDPVATKIVLSERTLGKTARGQLRPRTRKASLRFD